MSAAETDGQPKKLKGGFDPVEMGRRGGKRSAEARRQRAADRAAEQAAAIAAGIPPDMIPANKPNGERDGAQAPPAILTDPMARLRWEMLYSPNPASRVAAAKALLDYEQAEKPTPPTVVALRSLPTEELEALIGYMPSEVSAGSDGPELAQGAEAL